MRSLSTRTRAVLSLRLLPCGVPVHIVFYLALVYTLRASSLVVRFKRRISGLGPQTRHTAQEVRDVTFYEDVAPVLPEEDARPTSNPQTPCRWPHHGQHTERRQLPHRHNSLQHLKRRQVTKTTRSPNRHAKE